MEADLFAVANPAAPLAERRPRLVFGVDFTRIERDDEVLARSGNVVQLDIHGR